MEKPSISKATLGRLPRYLEILKNLPPNKVPYISATTIAKKLSLGEVQVRKDLSAVSGAGKPKLGYATTKLVKNLEEILGYNQVTEAVLVGAGKLGKALLQYDEFQKYGIKISAAFDLNEQVIRLGEKIEILPMNQFEDFCKTRNIQIGIIAVSEDSAQSVCDQMVKNRIVAIWNFVPCQLTVPGKTLIHNENLALSLAHLNNQIGK